jgi:hypothetical protein
MAPMSISVPDGAPRVADVGAKNIHLNVQLWT